MASLSMRAGSAAAQCMTRVKQSALGLRHQLISHCVNSPGVSPRAAQQAPSIVQRQDRRSTHLASAGSTHGLNDEQLVVVQSTAQHARVQAGPGTGKTRMVMEKITDVVTSGSSTGATVALTFSNMAAGELKGRLIDRLGAEVKASVVASTCHEYALEKCRAVIHELPSFGPFKRLTPLFGVCKPEVYWGKVPPEHKEVPTFGKVLERHGVTGVKQSILDDLRNDISSLKRGVPSVHGKTGLQLVEARDKALGPDELPFATRTYKCIHGYSFTQLYDMYQDDLCGRNEADFDDMISMHNAWASDLQVAARPCNTLSHVFVDEFQDINPAQYAMIKLLAPVDSDTQLFVVGDDNQAIYSFQGSKPVILNKELKQDYPGLQVYYLLKNHRSDRGIIELAEAMLHPDGAPDDFVKGIPVRPAALQKPCVYHEAESQEATLEVAAQVATWAYTTNQTCLVVSRTRVEVAAMIACLVARGIPVQYSNSEMWSTPEGQTMHALMSLAVNPDDVSTQQNVLNMPMCNLELAQLLDLMKAATAPGMSLSGTLKMLWDLCGIKSNVDTIAEAEARRAAQPKPQAASMKQQGAAVKQRADAKQQNDYRSAADRQSILGRMLQQAESASGGSAGGNSVLQRFLDTTRLMSEPASVAADACAVQVMTQHSVKGKEAGVVITTCGGLYRYFGRDQTKRWPEERTLGYVVDTRAKDHLVLLEFKGMAQHLPKKDKLKMLQHAVQVDCNSSSPDWWAEAMVAQISVAGSGSDMAAP